jgi:S-adenosylmethionine:tRNA ribosyltransferase-isomerase
LLIFNNTKVVQARLLFTKSTGASIEIFLLNPVMPNDYQLAFGTTSETHWNCIVGNIKRWKGEILELPLNSLGISLKAEMVSRTEDGALIKFNWDKLEISFAQVIELCGQVPIPPYLNREPEEEDKARYQTVYAKPEGSVAAPTAGLHFTNEVLSSLKSKRINFAEVTLHVGAGTFKPVKSETIGDHEMHTERIYITKSLINNILKTRGRIVVVGTTSMRTLESLYWLGVKLLENKEPFINPIVNQWDGYTLNAEYSIESSLNALLMHIDKTGSDYISASTRMIIVPGYKFRVVDVLITNFHQPRSTLLLLVAAFIGNDWTEVYNYALENNFRFLSYGDSSILFKKD